MTLMWDDVQPCSSTAEVNVSNYRNDSQVTELEQSALTSLCTI